MPNPRRNCQEAHCPSYAPLQIARNGNLSIVEVEKNERKLLSFDDVGAQVMSSAIGSNETYMCDGGYTKV